jgi:transcriptional regulator with XRE-family HTH domain
MSDQRIGAALRAVRIRRGWRQQDVATRAGISTSLVSTIERGHLAKLSIESLRQIAAALDVRIDVAARWRGGDLDRVVNAGHAALQTQVADLLIGFGWTVMPEVSFAYFGERGSIDLLAWHSPTQTLLVIEIKTEIVDVPGLLYVADRKKRLAPRIAAERGLHPRHIATWLVIADTSTNLKRARQVSGLLRAAFPANSRLMRKWLSSPTGRLDGLSFVSIYNRGGTKQQHASPKRVRRRKQPPIEHD